MNIHCFLSIILIISLLYVVYLIYTNNDLQMSYEFKQSIKREFFVTDSGIMMHFLGIEVNQSTNGISIHQKTYVTRILSRFGMEGCNKVRRRITPPCRLVKVENGKASNATSYKQMV